MSGLPNSATNFDADSADESYDSDQLSQMAALVACGEAPLPRHLPSRLLDRLVSEIREIRRRRLVKFIARAIASDIERSREQK